MTKHQCTDEYTIGHRLRVSNLDYGVDEGDIEELFLPLGPVISSSILYDKSGNSSGVAHVIYENYRDAVKAMKQYNRVLLDGLFRSFPLLNLF